MDLLIRGGTLVTMNPAREVVRGDLLALTSRWTQPLDREERAAASLVGAARHDDDLRAGLESALEGVGR